MNPVLMEDVSTLLNNNNMEVIDEFDRLKLMTKLWMINLNSWLRIPVMMKLLVLWKKKIVRKLII